MESLIEGEEFPRLFSINGAKMAKLDLYTVDNNYITFIQKAETAVRGFTRVPNMYYPAGKQKLVCGIVLQNIVNRINYYVGLTSYSIQKSENILINTGERHNPIKGSLRFNYMFPVPYQCLTRKIINSESDFNYKQLLIKEYRFIQANQVLIENKAKEVYDKIVNRICSKTLLENSCDFLVLEKALLKYISRYLK